MNRKFLSLALFCLTFLSFPLLIVSHTLSIPMSQNEAKEQKNEKLVMPAMARKAGGNWRPELNPIPTVPEAEETTSKETNEYESDSSDYWDSSEPECPEDMFYHILGKNCVPIFCPKVYAPKFPRRDPFTGECSMYLYGNYMTREYVEEVRMHRNSQFGIPCRRRHTGLVASICKTRIGYVG